jgi:ubiquinone/menaquinone biosynthesis C-methylase UbiE
MKRVQMAHDRIFTDEAYAASYAQRHQKMAENLGREIARKLQARGVQAGNILDVGCGSGATAIVLAQEFPQSEILGVDLSEPLLHLATLAAQAAGLADRVHFETGNAEQIPCEENSFDAVLSLNMVHIVEHPVQMLNEIERVLVPNGSLFIVDLRRSWLGLIEKEMKSALTLAEARTLFGRSSLREGSFSSSLIWWRFDA